ncbi:MAG: DUF1684 domain-containing protein [Alphaproteobacteria bacterium]|nr:DUF1684 domain-containing protein [Alphaproteobacteria bacterium]
MRRLGFLIMSSPRAGIDMPKHRASSNPSTPSPQTTLPSASTNHSFSLPLYVIEGYGGGLFLSYTDRAPHNYPGGRYVLDTIKGADLGVVPHSSSSDAGVTGASSYQGQPAPAEERKLIVDFNFSFSPSCAWSSDYVCPLPSPSSRLPFAVPVGERFA